MFDSKSLVLSSFTFFLLQSRYLKQRREKFFEICERGREKREGNDIHMLMSKKKRSEGERETRSLNLTRNSFTYSRTIIRIHSHANYSRTLRACPVVGWCLFVGHYQTIRLLFYFSFLHVPSSRWPCIFIFQPEKDRGFLGTRSSFIEVIPTVILL